MKYLLCLISLFVSLASVTAQPVYRGRFMGDGSRLTNVVPVYGPATTAKGNVWVNKSNSTTMELRSGDGSLATSNNLVIPGSLTASNSLLVNGTATFHAPSTNLSTLKVLGAMSISSLNASGSVTGAALRVIGPSMLMGKTTNQSDLRVEGSTTVLGNVTNLNNLRVAGNVNANSFVGDGSQLTGLPASGLDTNAVLGVVQTELTNQPSLVTVGQFGDRTGALLLYDQYGSNALTLSAPALVPQRPFFIFPGTLPDQVGQIIQVSDINNVTNVTLAFAEPGSGEVTQAELQTALSNKMDALPSTMNFAAATNSRSFALMGDDANGTQQVGLFWPSVALSNYNIVLPPAAPGASGYLINATNLGTNIFLGWTSPAESSGVIESAGGEGTDNIFTTPTLIDPDIAWSATGTNVWTFYPLVEGTDERLSIGLYNADQDAVTNVMTLHGSGGMDVLGSLHISNSTTNTIRIDTEVNAGPTVTNGVHWFPINLNGTNGWLPMYY